MRLKYEAQSIFKYYGIYFCSAFRPHINDSTRRTNRILFHFCPGIPHNASVRLLEFIRALRLTGRLRNKTQ